MDIPEGIRNIIFDLGGVVMDLDIEASRRAFVELGFDGSAFHLQRDDGKNLFVLYETGKMDTSTFLARLGELLPADPGAAVLTDAWNRMIVGFREPKVRLLQTLRGRYRTFLLSNTNPLHVARCDALLREGYGLQGLSDLFDRTYYSFTTGLRKPMPEIFERVLRENALVPQETLFLDDSEEHVAAAQRLGIVTRLVPRNGEL